MGITTTFAKATEAQCDGNVVQLLCLGNALIPEGKRRWELSISNFVDVLRSPQLGIEVDVSVIKQNIGRECFRITQKVEERENRCADKNADSCEDHCLL